MKPFECVGPDGQIYLHHDNWYRWKNDTLSSHNGEGKWRFDLDLRNPRHTLEEVPVSNSHVHSRFSSHTCFYECSDWSTIYDFYECNTGPMFRMIVESQNPEPIWGERITLLSSSTYFKPEQWGRNTPNQFAFFRGMYWQVVYSELLYNEFPWGVGYPLRDGNGSFGIPRRGRPINYQVAVDTLTAYTLNDLIESPNNYFYLPLIQQSPARRNIMSRYGQRLLEEGNQFYGNGQTDNDLIEMIERVFGNKVDWKQEGF